MASPGISPGLKGEKQTLVCEHNVAGHVNKFSTPAMIQLMEQAAIAGLTGQLQEGEVSVGIEVNVRHLEPTDRDGYWTIEDGQKEISFVLDDDGKVITMTVNVALNCTRMDDSIAKTD